MTSSEEVVHREAVGCSESQAADEDEDSHGGFTAENYCSANDAEKHKEDEECRGQWISGLKKSTKRMSAAGNHMFGCLSRRASLIGLPKAPDTEFKKQDYAARIRSRIAARCRAAPLVSIVPREAGENKKGPGFESPYEPSSPNVSCIGRVKLKKKGSRKLKALRNDRHGRAHGDQYPPPAETKPKHRLSWLRKMFRRRNSKADSSVMSINSARPPEHLCDAEDVAEDRQQLPKLKRFTSSHEPAALSNFFIEEFQSKFSEENGKEADDHKVAHSGPLLMEKKNLIDEPLPVPPSLGTPSEVNLWQRRCFAPPGPLEVKNPYGFDLKRPVTA